MAEQDADALQFENAEYDTPASDGPTCAACKRPIADAYYELFGAIVCGPCKDLIIANREGGSKVLRFLRAGAFGTAAAVAGFAIYFGVLKLTHQHIGLISILVGFMVGKAVNKGSNARGGWVYQLLAVFLTYSAIAASYSAVVVPGMIAEMREGSRQESRPSGQEGRCRPEGQHQRRRRRGRSECQGHVAGQSGDHSAVGRGFRHPGSDWPMRCRS